MVDLVEKHFEIRSTFAFNQIADLSRSQSFFKYFINLKLALKSLSIKVCIQAENSHKKKRLLFSFFSFFI